MSALATITDLRASELAQLGLSRSYASELLAGKKVPSLDVAVRIEREFGIRAADWVAHAEAAAKRDAA